MSATSKTSLSPSDSQMPQVSYLIVFFFWFPLKTNTCLKFCCVYRRVHAFTKPRFFLKFSISCFDFCTFYFCDYPISADFSLHGCVLAEELLFPLRLNASCLVEEIAFSFQPLIFPVSVSLDFPVLSWVFPLPFDFPHKCTQPLYLLV